MPYFLRRLLAQGADILTVVTMRYGHTNTEATERAVRALGTGAKRVTVLPKPRQFSSDEIRVRLKTEEWVSG
jgi:hypothetical protein